MIDVRMGQDDSVDSTGSKNERSEIQFLEAPRSLEHSAVDQQAGL